MTELQSNLAARSYLAKELTVKLPFVLASACVTLAWVNSIPVQANTINTSSVAVVSNDARAPRPEKIKLAANKDSAEEACINPLFEQGEADSTPKQPATRVAEKQTDQRARSLLLLLHILQSAK